MAGFKSKKMMAKQLDYKRERLIEISEKEKAFIQLEDGFYYWGPTRVGGVLSANDLRTIADILDDKNADWEKELVAYFDATKHKCCLNDPDCKENCGNYGCGN